MSPDEVVRAAAVEVQERISRRLRAMSDEEKAKTGFDQGGLEDGLAIVEDYLRAGERGCAIDHLRYMIDETETPLPAKLFAPLAELCARLEVRSPRDFGRQ